MMNDCNKGDNIKEAKLWSVHKDVVKRKECHSLFYFRVFLPLVSKYDHLPCGMGISSSTAVQGFQMKVGSGQSPE